MERNIFRTLKSHRSHSSLDPTSVWIHGVFDFYTLYVDGYIESVCTALVCVCMCVRACVHTGMLPGFLHSSHLGSSQHILGSKPVQRGGRRKIKKRGREGMRSFWPLMIPSILRQSSHGVIFVPSEEP